MTVLIREAPVDVMPHTECIRTAAAKYGRTILQLYENKVNEYGYEVNCEWYPKKTSSCSIRQKIIVSKSFCIVWAVHILNLN